MLWNACGIALGGPFRSLQSRFRVPAALSLSEANCEGFAQG